MACRAAPACLWSRAALRRVRSPSLPPPPASHHTATTHRPWRAARWAVQQCPSRRAQPHRLPPHSTPPLPQALENRALDSKREMDILSALDEMRSLKARRGGVAWGGLRRGGVARGGPRRGGPAWQPAKRPWMPSTRACRRRGPHISPAEQHGSRRTPRRRAPHPLPDPLPSLWSPGICCLQARHEQVDTEAALAALKRSAHQEAADLDAEDEEAVRCAAADVRLGCGCG